MSLQASSASCQPWTMLGEDPLAAFRHESETRIRLFAPISPHKTVGEMLIADRLDMLNSRLNLFPHLCGCGTHLNVDDFSEDT